MKEVIGVSELKESGTSATFSCAHQVGFRLCLAPLFAKEVEISDDKNELNKHFPDSLYLRLPNSLQSGS